MRNFYIGLSILLGLTIFHGVALPIVISYDGQMYIDQALMIGEPRFWSDWHFLRTPLFQTLTRIGFLTVGENRDTLVVVTTGLGFFGLVLLQKILKKWVSDLISWLVTLLTACMPTLIAYQHSFLTEAGTFLFLALIILSLINCIEKDFSLRSCVSVGMVVATGYYFRPTVLILSIAASLLYLLFSRPFSKKVFFRVLLMTFLLPNALSVPWKYFGRNTHWETDQVLFGLFNQAVPGVDSPALGDAQQRYIHAINSSLVNGSLSMSGVRDGELYPIIGLLHNKVEANPTKFFIDTVTSYPVRYVKGIIRGQLYLMGVSGVDSDNETFEKSVFENGDSVILPGPARLDSYVRAHFSATGEKSKFFASLYSLTSTYRWLYRIGAFLLMPVLAICWYRNNSTLFTFCAVPFIFLTYHAIVLFSLDRMAVPVAPFVISLPFVCIYLIFMPPSSQNAK